MIYFQLSFLNFRFVILFVQLFSIQNYSWLPTHERDLLSITILSTLQGLICQIHVHIVSVAASPNSEYSSIFSIMDSDSKPSYKSQGKQSPSIMASTNIITSPSSLRIISAWDESTSPLKKTLQCSTRSETASSVYSGDRRSTVEPPRNLIWTRVDHDKKMVARGADGG